ncbi:preprotein translocase subunit SecG [Tepidamorphus sp. 3E244]|uniref:preprotein translocase subunit SecG n=1 Tax=Tepidamorphus sp. 3E244 TaxID=3385498 RepID=UPI0038FC747F
METVIIVVHLMVVIALIGVILLQKSEGGALGMGGGGGGNFLSGRGSANVLTRATTYLAAAFFATSFILTMLHGGSTPGSIFDNGTAPVSAPANPGAATTDELNNQLPGSGGQQDNSGEPQVPISQ